MDERDTDSWVRSLPERLAARAADPHRRASPVRFDANYDLGEGRHGAVSVEVGAMAPAEVRLYLVWQDRQLVEIDDPRVLYTVSGTVQYGRLVDLHYRARPGGPFLDRLGAHLRNGLLGRDAIVATQLEDPPLPTHEIVQRDLRALPVASMIKSWANVGREFQDALKRYAAAAGIVYESGYDPQGLAPDDSMDPIELARALIEETRLLDRLFSSDDVAIRTVRDAFARVATQPRKRRGTAADDKAAQLQRVVAEYRAAVERGDRAPRRAVAERLRYHETHIGRLLAEARANGLLPRAKPRGKRTRASTEGRKPG